MAILDVRDRIHERALALARTYQKAEIELVDALIEVDQHRVYLSYGHPSLFQYVVRDLGLTESVAYNLIVVARKASEVPALKEAIDRRQISLTNARFVAAVLCEANQDVWLPKAMTLSRRELQREVARVRPELLVPERAIPVGEDRVRLEVGITEEDLRVLRRAQDLLCRSRKRLVGLDEVLGVLAREFVRREDPIERARRRKATEKIETPVPVQVVRGVDSGRATRMPIPSILIHQVNLRDQQRCTHVLDGQRCGNRRWLEIHHVIPVSQGGQNTLENLVTLCSAHHKAEHIP